MRAIAIFGLLSLLSWASAEDFYCWQCNPTTAGGSGNLDCTDPDNDYYGVATKCAGVDIANTCWKRIDKDGYITRGCAPPSNSTEFEAPWKDGWAAENRCKKDKVTEIKDCTCTDDNLCNAALRSSSATNHILFLAAGVVLFLKHIWA